MHTALDIHHQDGKENFNNQDFPLFTLFKSLQGDWNFTRNLNSTNKNLPSGNVIGTCGFSIASKELQQYIYNEQGVFYSDVGEMNVKKNYVYELSDNMLSVYFTSNNEKSDLFHHLDFDTPRNVNIASGYHLCGNDEYFVKYQFALCDDGSVKEFSITYKVIGPMKNYTSFSKYRR
ncbi:NhaA1 [Acrasis kona]|uniref:NhaA1 n=1 Tax=Acrasis kona TaxID=1008807 RepID=A0AAW2ZFQ6_9EUKA